MIHAVVFRDFRGQIKKFRIIGHSDYEEAGRDIVCAAVSAITQTAVLGLIDVVGIKVDYQQKKGNVECVITEEISAVDREKVTIVLETMVCGLKSIQAGYSEYIRVEERRSE